MVARITAALLAFVAAASTAAASAVPRHSHECNTGPIQCCNNVQESKHYNAEKLSALLNVVVGDVTGLIASDCSPITVIGAAGTSCSSQPVCCQNNAYGGLVSIGCVPVSLGGL
ncbi:fungal hydrophobin-domain-containing protein [Trametes elegans]|nr:fungal hydrophobin-domain-containing protein [Trametes elegans]